MISFEQLLIETVLADRRHDSPPQLFRPAHGEVFPAIVTLIRARCAKRDEALEEVAPAA